MDGPAALAAMLPSSTCLRQPMQVVLAAFAPPISVLRRFP